jgi:hypothetical protein
MAQKALRVTVPDDDVGFSTVLVLTSPEEAISTKYMVTVVWTSDLNTNYNCSDAVNLRALLLP